MAWGNKVEWETKIRMVLTAAAYAYEIEDDPIMNDNTFDAMCKQVDLTVDTTRPDLDSFFREHFDPSTGVWIHHHPELDKVALYVERLRKFKQ